MICKLALEDGSVFTGSSFGATGTLAGEVVFNTSMTGYQEIVTDPSYCGQIVTMTFPLIGNYGVNREDFESSSPYLSGLVVKELPVRPSNYRADMSLSDFLAERNVIGLAGIDTRALTRRVRIHGALRGVLSTEISDEVQLVKMANESSSMAGANLVEKVAPDKTESWSQPLWQLEKAKEAVRADCRVVVIDCGVKQNILRYMVSEGCEVTVVPADTDAGKIKELSPDGVVVSNGPGDPAAVVATVNVLKELIGTVPVLGVCLGHQMLSLALGAETYKLKFGHHGANVPVINHFAGRVEITSQNHGFAVDRDSLKEVGGVETHINLNDNSLEGFVHVDKQITAVQFHPEASPGPHDSGSFFGSFVRAIREGTPLSGESLYGR